MGSLKNNVMKKLFLAVMLLICFTGCEYDDTSIREELKQHDQRLSELESLCKRMNTSISTLQTLVTALQNNDYVTGVTPVLLDNVEIGYTITFTKSSPITIYHGKDGHTPQIGVKQDTDGIYYWTLNGEWLFDDSGNKISPFGIAGVTPRLKIEDGIWYISYDNENTWEQLGKATGEDGDSFFEGVDYSNSNYVVIKLSDGTVINIPKYIQLDIKLSAGPSIAMTANSSMDIQYEIQSQDDEVGIDVVTSNDVKANIVMDNINPKKGYIHIKTGDTIDVNSRVVIFVFTKDNVIMRRISFDVPELKHYDNSEKVVKSAGGELELDFLSNVECKVVIPDSAKQWISLPETRASWYQCITVNVATNMGKERSATVKIQSLDGNLSINYHITQEGSIVVINSHDAVDLGLSVMWSTCNYGANSYSDVGGYYLWGDPTGQAVFPIYTAPYIDSISGTQYDIARKTWGENWRIPTMADFRELYSRCTWIDMTENNVSGIKITGPNGNSIFLPKTGIGMPDNGPMGTYQVGYKDNGYYMTGDSYSDTYGKFAYVCEFSSAQSYKFPSWNANFVLIPIRPVVNK